MKVLVVGIGAAGNKAMLKSIEMGVVAEEDTLLVNSTSKDIPKEYQGEIIIISPDNRGCGKEIKVADLYAKEAIRQGKFTNDRYQEYNSVVILTSTEGGTGSGSTPVIANFFNKIYGKNVHVIAFTGFEDDVRGLANTVEFFKQMKDNFMIQIISTASFLGASSKNVFKAQQLANEECARRIKIMTGQDFMETEQNIDEMDLLKLSNTAGYMTVEYIEPKKSLVDTDDFNQYVRQMILNSHSIKSSNPAAARIGMILNLSPASEDAIDSTYGQVIEAYGKPYEIFTQKQWDENKEYIAFIVSGMKMPMSEIEAIYTKYREETDRVNKNTDEFFDSSKEMVMNQEDEIFNMISGKSQSTMSVNDFLDSL